MNYDNPAALLHNILASGLKAERKKACRQVWAELLLIPEGDTSALFSGLGKVMTLPIETSSLVTRYFPHLSSSIELWRNPLEAAFFNQQIGGTWETFIQHINSYCTPQLATLAELIHTKTGTLIAEEKSVNDLLSQFTELTQQIEECDLSPDLKLHLIKELLNLRLNLSEYFIVGSSPAIRQAEAIVGHMHRDKRFYDFLTSHEVGKRVLDNLNALVGVLTVVVSVSQIAAPTFALLPK